MSEWQPSASIEMIKHRARIMKMIRAFFDCRGVLEVETPVLSAAGTTDANIHSLLTEFHGKRYYLNTSPEFAMKRLLAAYQQPVYQICKVFRDDEQGPLHNPEFTMLEWYRPRFDLFQLMDEVADLLTVLAEKNTVKTERKSYRRLFEQHAGIDPHTASVSDCATCAQAHGIDIPVGLSADNENDKDAWLDWLLTQLIMPALDPEALTFIYDYPATQCALAKLEQDGTGTAVAKRFECIYRGLELANGFDELRDADEQRHRFEQENEQRRRQGRPEVVIDSHLLAALQHGLPQCSGVALGVDRLLMALNRIENIEHVLTFPWQRI